MKGIQDSTNNFIISKALPIKRLQGGKQPDIRSPISLDLLEKITAVLDKVCKDKYEATLSATAFSIVFFGLLRVGEITSSRNQSFNNASLKLQDITVYEKSVELRIRWSKTDQKGRSVKLCIPGNGKIYCPLELIKNYLLRRPCCSSENLFIYFNHMPLTRYQFTSVLKKALNLFNIEKGHFRSHSFRIGGATELARQGVPEKEIMKLGRWQNFAYSSYIRLNFSSFN
jgi:integrase